MKPGFKTTARSLPAEIDSQRSRTYLFELGSFRPLALHEQDNIQPSGATFIWIISAHWELTDSQVRIVWSVGYCAYGNLALADVKAVDNPL